MDDHQWLAGQFDQKRAHLRAVARRMLGTASEAEDAVQEAWLKLNHAATGEVANIGGWLTTVVARVCLDRLRSRKSRREEPLGQRADVPSDATPDAELAMAEALGPAVLIVFDMLAPAERVAFVLHDMFDMSFEEIAPIVARTPAATRQLASRARRRIRGAPAHDSDLAQHREIVSAFLAASREGDFQRLVTVLSSDVVLHADELAVRTAAEREQHGAPRLAPEIRGAQLVANVFKGRARAASTALIDGDAGAVWAMGGQVRSAFVFTIEEGKITMIDLVMEPTRLAELDVEVD
ncbi:MAG: sigma-70 family RNA polymerase sigma factor [Clostridia bacterium]|nr:sigma-70 family RNA polymerase sigma factor [Deltaproteobacteria bacterium]